MTPHKVQIFDKSILFTDKSVFRVEESRDSHASYEGVYAHKDPIRCINYYNNYEKLNNAPLLGGLKKGLRVRLVKDGDEFIVIKKKIL